MKRVSERFNRNETETPEKLLLSACMSGSVSYAASLLKKGADPDTVLESNGKSLLHITAGKGYSVILSLLISAGADVNIKDNEGGTPLHDAIYSGQLINAGVVQKLLEAGADVTAADVNACDDNGWTPLHCAVSGGVTELIKLLLKAGADPNILNKEGISPLYISVTNKNTESADLVIHYMGEVRSELVPMLMLYAIRTHNEAEIRKLASEWGNWAEPVRDIYPLFTAVKSKDMDILRLLLELGAGRTAGAFSSALEKAVFNDDIGMARMLLEAGADPNVLSEKKIENCDLPLVEAARRGNVEMIRLLLDHGADVLLKGRYGECALPAAVHPGNDRTVMILAKAGADINARDGNSFTSLHLAAMRENTGLMLRLIKMGADTDLRTKTGDTALDILEKYYFEKYEKKREIFAKTIRETEMKRISREDRAKPVASGFEFDI